MKVQRGMLVIALCVIALSRLISAAQDPQLSVEPVVLSDTYGYDFGPYLHAMTQQVMMTWHYVLPEAARQGQKGRVVIIFTVLRDGTVQDLRTVSRSGSQALDQAAETAIQNTSPFSKLPDDFRGNRLIVQFSFLYNQ